MKSNRFGSYSGIIFGIIGVPLLILNIYELGDDFTTDSIYVANLLDRYQLTMATAGIGFVSVILLLAHLQWLSDVVSQHAPFAARVATASAQITATAIALGYGLTTLAAYGAQQKFPERVVRTTGMISGNLVIMQYVGLVVFAGLIAVLGWQGKYPRWIALIATLEVLLAVITAVTGASAVSAIITIVWLLANSVGLSLYTRKNT